MLLQQNRRKCTAANCQLLLLLLYLISGGWWVKYTDGQAGAYARGTPQQRKLVRSLHFTSPPLIEKGYEYVRTISIGRLSTLNLQSESNAKGGASSRQRAKDYVTEDLTGTALGIAATRRQVSRIAMRPKTHGITGLSTRYQVFILVCIKYQYCCSR